MPDQETTTMIEGVEDATVALDERLSAIEAVLQADGWAGRVMLRGGLPRSPVLDALPTAADQYAYAIVTLRGTPDITYCCLRSAAAVWDWRIVATG
jgi:hypothetical protein